MPQNGDAIEENGKTDETKMEVDDEETPCDNGDDIVKRDSPVAEIENNKMEIERKLVGAWCGVFFCFCLKQIVSGC